MKRTVLILTLLVLVPLSAGAAEEDEEFDLLKDRTRKAIATLNSELEELALWADKNKLFAARDEAYELLIVYATEHRAARQCLRYHRNREGVWQRRTYKRPRNHERELVPEFERRMKEIRTKFIASMHVVLDACTQRPIRQQIELADIMLRFDPDDAKSRRIRKETKLDGKWVLDETARAKLRRVDFAKTVTEITDGMKKPKKVPATEDERKLGVDWVGFWQGVWWRASGTTDSDEVLHALKMLDASHPFFDHAFGTKTTVPPRCGFYLLSGKEEAGTVLQNHALISDAKREYFLRLRAAWVPHHPIFFHWSDSPVVRLDGSVRMALGLLILRNFKINTTRGWVWEGLGLYLDYCLTGSHRTVFVTPEMKTRATRRTPFDIETRMKKPGADWIQLAFDLVTGDAAPPIELMTKKKVNKMDPEDLVYAYALVAYIVEGHEDRAAAFFSYHGNQRKFVETVEKVFEIPFDYFMERYHRWLHEIT
jgi:hypothetical protein